MVKELERVQLAQPIMLKYEPFTFCCLFKVPIEQEDSFTEVGA